MKERINTIVPLMLILSVLLAGCAPLPTSGVSAPVIDGPTLPAAASSSKSDLTLPPTALATIPVATMPPGSDSAQATAALAAAATWPPGAMMTPTLAPDAWKEAPIVPTQISERSRQIYQSGLALGNNPNAFSKVGDCESSTEWYLGDFDKGLYNLGPYTSLEPVIKQYAGSYSRLSLATKPGFTAASLMVPLWSTDKTCGDDEAPLACEYRLNRPSIALITVGTNDIHRPEKFEANLRRVIDYTIAQGALPVLATKADNLEKNGSINATIAQLAYEYELPLWNFWLAVQPLYHGGLQEDGAHLTWNPNDFSNPNNLKQAWPVRNLTALQVLDAVWRGLNP